MVVPTGGIAVILAYGSLLLLRPLIPASVPLAQEATLGYRVLLFSLAIASLTALMTGIVPALRVSSANPAEVMKLEGRSSTAGRRQHDVVAILIASEVGMTQIGRASCRERVFAVV